ncbi:MAG: ribosome hibernation-promoting factor, HPF/YfiA family [Francisellaceae bacterium]
MQIQLTGRHLDITPSMKQYVEDKLSKLRNHFDQILVLKVILSVEREKQIAEAIINAPGCEFVAKADATDMYAAIDSLQDKLDAQIRKHKQKLKSHRNGQDRADIEEALTESEE